MGSSLPVILEFCLYPPVEDKLRPASLAHVLYHLGTLWLLQVGLLDDWSGVDIVVEDEEGRDDTWLGLDSLVGTARHGASHLSRSLFKEI